MLTEIEKIPQRPAPRPGRASYLRSIYDAVEAHGRKATKTDILSLVPSTKDAYKWEKHVSAKRFEDLMYSAVYRGHLIFHPADKAWSIAPIAYYHERQEHIAKIRKAQKRPITLSPGQIVEFTPPPPDSDGFWKGVTLGIAVGALSVWLVILVTLPV